jgi:hypothetical protein
MRTMSCYDQLGFISLQLRNQDREVENTGNRISV